MRSIERDMLSAVTENRKWQQANTAVVPIDSANCAVYLHGHCIATVNSRTGFVIPDLNTLRQWPTRTTQSRLRALGVDVCTRDHTVYVDGMEL